MRRHRRAVLETQGSRRSIGLGHPLPAPIIPKAPPRRQCAVLQSPIGKNCPAKASFGARFFPATRPTKAVQRIVFKRSNKLARRLQLAKRKYVNCLPDEGSLKMGPRRK